MVQPAAPAGRPNLGGASARHGSMQIGGGGVRLDPDDVEAIAQRVAELLGARGCTRAVRYVDAAELARVLGVERDWVYAHARPLGAIRLGGPHGRLRFDLQHVQRTLAEDDTPPASGRPPRRPGARRRSTREGLELLPYES